MSISPLSSALSLALNNLPALPESLSELLDACNAPDADIYAIGTMVAHDVTLSIRILQLANSAFLGARAGFSQIEHAVVYLGLDTVRNLAISVSVHEAFRNDNGSGTVNLPEFWYHSLFTAVYAKSLAEQYGYPSPAEAYLCGLLHDLGKLLLAASFPEEYQRLTASRQPLAALVTAEREAFGLDHAAASALLVSRWQLPEHISQAIGRHHTPPATETSLAGIIHAANLASTQPAAANGQGSGEPAEAGEVQAASLEAAHATVENIAQGLGITVTRPALQAASPPAGQAPPEKAGLRQKTEQITIIHGALDNLLRAGNRERICRIVEETLRLLADLNSSLLLPDEAGQLQPVLSTANPWAVLASELNAIAAEADSIIHRCRQAAAPIWLDRSAADCRASDRKLTALLSSGCLLAVPIPLDPGEQGVLLVGLEKHQESTARSLAEPLRFLAGHLGARLHIEALSRRHSAEMVRREMAGVEKVCRNIAHEITNPLAIMHNYLGVMRQKNGSSTSLAEDLQRLGDEIDRIGSIVRQLENIGERTNRQDATMRLDHLLRETLDYFRASLFELNSIEVQVRLEAATRPLPVEVNCLRQVLTILFTNAAEAIGSGGRIEVRSGLEPGTDTPFEHFLVLSICDDGPGVPLHLLPSIFSAGISSKGSGHLGLGLSIARRLLHDRNGTITCTSRPGGGACFHLRLPVS